MQQLPRYLICFAIFVAASLTWACNSERAQLEGQHGQLPDLASLEAHATTSVPQYTWRGIDSSWRSPGTSEQGDSLLLTAADGELQWAIYQFVVFQQFHIQGLDWASDDSATTEYWIGITQWDNQSWHIEGPFSTSGAINLLNGGNFVSPLGRTYVAVMCTDGNAVKLDSIGLNGNYDPFAEFQASPQVGEPGTPVALSAANSFDGDGTIVRYEWDLDGNGTFETDRGSDSSATTFLPFPEGTQLIALKVTDDDGGFSGKQLILKGESVGPGVPRQLASEASSINTFMLVNGNPAIFYEDSQGLQLLRASNAEGTSWSSPVRVHDSAEDVARMAIVGGKPAVVVPHQGPDSLLYISAKDVNGSAWNAPVTAFTGTTGMYPRLIDCNGKPGVAFATGSAGLFFVHALDGLGQTWVPPVSVDNRSVSSSGAVSVATVNSRPAIGYFVQDNNGLYYVRSFDVLGDVWGTPVPCGPATTNFHSWLTIVENNPAMINFSSNDDALIFVRATDGDGAAWAPRLPVIPGYGGSKIRHSFAVIGGYPTIVYSDSGPARLEICEATQKDGSVWGAPSLLMNLTTPNNPSPQITEVMGNLGVTYIDDNGSNDALYYFRSN